MKKTLPISILILVGFVFLFNPFEKKEKVNPLLLKKTFPQEYMSSIKVWSYTPEGNLKNKLTAEYWAYLPEIRASKIKIPHLTVYKPDATIWHIDALSAEVKQPNIGNIEELQLKDQVVLQRQASKNIAPLKLETSILYYQPKKEYAETPAFITMTKPDLTVTGMGMRAFLDKTIIELLNDVKTQYLGKI